MPPRSQQQPNALPTRPKLRKPKLKEKGIETASSSCSQDIHWLFISVSAKFDVHVKHKLKEVIEMTELQGSARRLGFTHRHYLTVKDSINNSKLQETLDKMMSQNMNSGTRYFKDVLFVEAEILVVSHIKKMTVPEADRLLHPLPGNPEDRPGDPVERPGYPVDRPGNPVDRSGDPVERLWYPVDRPVYHVERPRESCRPLRGSRRTPMVSSRPPSVSCRTPKVSCRTPYSNPVDRSGDPVERLGYPADRPGYPVERPIVYI
ncbi:unnamed protein product [Mytilus edulis]|uniref:Uncharacterized protein n=1 Tax=Mytilus edulis TaxID=6550 RepID=A0A8S3QF06_MYTED|nr:unnamed protein product [Mytilus edulis]